jgi:hypothetical protein
MSLMEPTNPVSGGGGAPESQGPGEKSKSPADWNPKPMTWLGMHFDVDQTKKLWNIISQNIGDQINREKQRALKAIRRLRKLNDTNPSD